MLNTNQLNFNFPSILNQASLSQFFNFKPKFTTQASYKIQICSLPLNLHPETLKILKNPKPPNLKLTPCLAKINQWKCLEYQEGTL